VRVFHLLTEGMVPFNPRNLTEGRMDEVARFIHNALFLSHDLRRDVIARVTLFRGELAPLTVSVDGSRVKGLHPDERSIGGFLSAAIRAFVEGRSLPPGVSIERGFEVRPGVVLDEGGERKNPRANYFYVGGPKGFPVELELPKISVGGKVYTASQTVCIVNYLLDVGEWTLE